MNEATIANAPGSKDSNTLVLKSLGFLLELEGICIVYSILCASLIYAFSDSIYKCVQARFRKVCL